MSRPLPRTGPARQLALALCASVALAAPVRAQDAPPIDFVAYLEGTALEQPADVVVDVWDAAAGGSLLYREIHDAVDLGTGVLAIAIGAGLPTADGVFDRYGADVFRAPERYLGLRIGSEDLAPRTPFGSAAYAALASTALDSERLAGDPVAALQKLVDGACPDGESIRSIDADGGVVCEFDDGTSYEARSGLQLSGATFSVDFAAVQARISETCPPGSAIRSIGADGSLACAPDLDTDTTYAAGSGLDLADETFAIDPDETQRRVAAACPASQAIRTIDAKGHVSCDAVATGDITAIETVPGSGLVGGCESGACQLSVDYDRLQRRLSSCPLDFALRGSSATGATSCANVRTGDVRLATAPGSGLDSSCTSGVCSVGIDPNETQRRVAECPPGSAIRAIAADGSVACQTLVDGDIGGVGTANGSGLQGGCNAGTCTLGVAVDDAWIAPQISYTAGSVLVDTWAPEAETVRSLSLTAPAGFGGSVVAIASGDAECEQSSCALEMELFTSPADIDIDIASVRLNTRGNRLRSVAATRVFAIAAGETLTVYWRASRIGSNGDVRIYRPRLIAYFLPN
ncbi:MAG: hypothetical protein QNK03_24200 [Myxococcota bacterium]|nr:hypothetical protein [Myxococcota bacterium]